MILKVIFVALFASLAFAEDVKEAKPIPAIEKAIAPALAEATKGYVVYQEALAKATDKAVKELEKLKAVAMKKGDLSLAVAVDTQIKAFKEGSLGNRVVEKPKDAEDPLGKNSEPSKPDSKSPIIGKWQRVDANGKEFNEKTYKCTWEFCKDGSGLTNSFGKVHWKLLETNKYQVTVDPGQDPKWSFDRFITVVDDGTEIIEAMGRDLTEGTHYRKADDKSIKPAKEKK